MRRVLVAALLALACLHLVAGPALAQATPTPTPGPIETEAPFYDDENASANMTEWAPDGGNATADGIMEMVARIPGMFIGTGEQDPSGSGYQGFLLTALVMGGATLMAVRGIGIGPVAGSMIATVLTYGLTLIGLLPMWVQPILLFTLVGVPASAALIRVFRG